MTAPCTRSGAASTVQPRLHLILGPTCSGKTRRATAAAARGECPVIALDRIQCHPEIAVGSGRPPQRDLADTTRLYLDDRPLSYGPITARSAVDRLVRTQRRLLSGTTTLILEGGSISLLRALLQRTDWCRGWLVHATVCIDGGAHQYATRVSTEVRRMLGYTTAALGARTFQDELAALWDDPVTRKQAYRLVGYRQAIDLCERDGLTPRQLAAPGGHRRRQDLEDTLRQGHLAYASQQRQAFAKALPALSELAERVEVREV
ncbi:isopentenyl transferase family protein [Streptomyces rhizosphaericus]|nr:isopentenyl transferase family protein [Streptomyces rhizosphaericus]